MIIELEIVCDEISCVGTVPQTPGSIKVVLNNVYTDFLQEIEADEIVKFQDVDKILESIGVEEVGEWLMSKGSL